jgi:hypothetical protein
MKPYAKDTGNKATKYGLRTVAGAGMQNMMRIDRKRARQQTQKKIKEES